MKAINAYINEKLVLNKDNVKDYVKSYEDDVKEVIDVINNFFDDPDTKISIDVEHIKSTERDYKNVEIYKIFINLNFKNNKSSNKILIEEYTREILYQVNNIKTSNKKITVPTIKYDENIITLNVVVSK